MVHVQCSLESKIFWHCFGDVGLEERVEVQVWTLSSCFCGGLWPLMMFPHGHCHTFSKDRHAVERRFRCSCQEQLPRNVFMVWDPRAGDWQPVENGFFCLPSHLLPSLLAGRSAYTASVLRRSTWWQWCPWRWRRLSANSCLTSRGTRPQTTTQAAPWRNTHGSRQGWSLNRYHSWWEGTCGWGCPAFLIPVQKEELTLLIQRSGCGYLGWWHLGAQWEVSPA